jgi:hypothetical protein
MFEKTAILLRAAVNYCGFNENLWECNGVFYP